MTENVGQQRVMRRPATLSTSDSAEGLNRQPETSVLRLGTSPLVT